MFWITWRKFFCGTIVAACFIVVVHAKVVPTGDWFHVNSSESSKAPQYSKEKDDRKEYIKENTTRTLTDGTQESITVLRDNEGHIVSTTKVTYKYNFAFGDRSSLLVSPSNILRVLGFINSGLEMPFNLIQGRGVPTVVNVSSHENSGLIWCAWLVVGALGAGGVYFEGSRRYVQKGRLLLWTAGTLLSPILIVPYYLQFRPQGDLGTCPRCGRTELLSLASCPHCGRGWAGQAGETHG